MPPTTPSRASSGPRRRTLLAGVLGAGTAAALLSACSDGDPVREEAKQASAERRLRERSARDSRALLRRYDATIDAHPALAALLAPLRAETARHADALGGREGSGSAFPAAPSPPARDGGPATSPPAPGSGPDRSEGDAARVPGDEKDARAALADAERRTADSRTGALAGASPEFARLLASVAASGAAHAYLLTEAP